MEGAIESNGVKVLCDELDGLVAGHSPQLLHLFTQLHQLLTLLAVLLPQSSVFALHGMQLSLQILNFLLKTHVFEVI